jgi:hypothetical protein
VPDSNNISWKDITFCNATTDRTPANVLTTFIYKNTGWFKIIVGVSVVYNFQTGKNKIKLLTGNEDVTRKVLFGVVVLPALMSGRKYDVIPQIGDVVTELSMEKIHLQKAISRDWLCSAPKRSCDRNSYTANAGEHLEGNWIPLGHLTCHERRACWSCLAFCSIDSKSIKTFWVTISYSVSSFILLFLVWKL